MIRFTTSKHPTISGFTQIVIDLPDAGWEDSIYEGPEAANRLMRFARALIAGTGDQMGVNTPKGWTREGISADGVHAFRQGRLRAHVSVHQGLLCLSVSTMLGMANDQQCAFAGRAFVPKGVTVKEKNLSKSHVRYFWGVLPGYRMEFSGTGEQPYAVKE